MKYIRIKDTIYEYSNEDEIHIYLKSQYGSMLIRKDSKNKYEFVESIEELCDEFVIFGLFAIPYLLPKWQVNEHFKKLEQFGGNIKSRNKYEIKGAIWTDKGLIYVAKMNEKGELELL